MYAFIMTQNEHLLRMPGCGIKAYIIYMFRRIYLGHTVDFLLTLPYFRIKG